MCVFASMVLAVLSVSPELDEGRLAYSAMKYDKAIDALTRVCTDARGPEGERIEACDLLARAHLALGHLDAAQASYRSLLALDPMAPEPQGAPKVRAAFRQAKEASFAPRFVAVKRRASSPDVLEFDVLNPWAIDCVVELHEAGADHVFAMRQLTLSAHRVVASLKPGSANFVRVVANDGVVLATLGSGDAPIAGPRAADAPVLPPTVAPPIVVSAVTSTQAATGLERREVAGIVVASLGLVAMIIGGILLGIGADEQSRGANWIFNDLDLARAEELQRSGPAKMVAGGIVGTLGLAGVVTGGVLFFLAPPPVATAQ